jgi:hypothetical protein
MGDISLLEFDQASLINPLLLLRKSAAGGIKTLKQ